MITNLLILLLDFDWKALLFGEDDVSFLLMVFIRTFIMFLVILVGLRIMGKQSVHQLSVFELGVIIGLGSAAGDPMFYKSVGLLFCILVFAVLIASYHLLKYLISRYPKLRIWLEGSPVELIKDGKMDINLTIKEMDSMEDLFLLLRVKSIAHLGQIRSAILETDGQLSLYYFDDENVKYGLSIIPSIYEYPIKNISYAGQYSCTHCSHTTFLNAGSPNTCSNCNKNKWIIANKELRVV